MDLSPEPNQHLSQSGGKGMEAVALGVAALFRVAVVRRWLEFSPGKRVFSRQKPRSCAPPIARAARSRSRGHQTSPTVQSLSIFGGPAAAVSSVHSSESPHAQ